MAVRNAQDDDLAAIRDAVEAMEAPGIGMDDMLALDIDFHVAISRAAHNAVLELAMNAVHLVRPYSNTMLVPLLRIATIAEQHRAIYEAISARDEAAAERAFEAHMAHLGDVLERRSPISGRRTSASARSRARRTRRWSASARGSCRAPGRRRARPRPRAPARAPPRRRRPPPRAGRPRCAPRSRRSAAARCPRGTVGGRIAWAKTPRRSAASQSAIAASGAPTTSGTIGMAPGSTAKPCAGELLAQDAGVGLQRGRRARARRAAGAAPRARRRPRAAAARSRRSACARG